MLGKMLLTATLAAVCAHTQSVGTAFRTVTLAPEEIDIEIVVTTLPTVLSEQAAALLAPLGLDAQDLRGVGAVGEARLGWHYSWVRPYSSIDDTLKRIVVLKEQLAERGIGLSYEFFLRPSPKTFETTRRKVLAELMNEARKSSGSSGKVRSVMIEPRPETLDANRAAATFGRSSGALQIHFSVVAVFENE